MTQPRLQPKPAFRPFRDPDAGLLRRSILIGDTDEWSATDQRVRIFRNGSSHFAVCEVSATGKPHPAITRMVPDVAGVPDCSVIVSVPADQVDTLLEELNL
jgi:hypothetical protein